MNKLRFLFIALAAAVISILSGCEEETPVQNPPRPVGFIELIEAYEAGKVFDSAEPASGNCKIIFADGSTLTVPGTAFIILQWFDIGKPSSEGGLGDIVANNLQAFVPFCREIE